MRRHSNHDKNPLIIKFFDKWLLFSILPLGYLSLKVTQYLYREEIWWLIFKVRYTSLLLPFDGKHTFWRNKKNYYQIIPPHARKVKLKMPWRCFYRKFVIELLHSENIFFINIYKLKSNNWIFMGFNSLNLKSSSITM